MGRIVLTEFVSLDGVIQAPGGNEDFRDAAWSSEFDRGEGDIEHQLREAIRDWQDGRASLAEFEGDVGVTPRA